MTLPLLALTLAVSAAPTCDRGTILLGSAERFTTAEATSCTADGDYRDNWYIDVPREMEVEIRFMASENAGLYLSTMDGRPVDFTGVEYADGGLMPWRISSGFIGRRLAAGRYRLQVRTARPRVAYELGVLEPDEFDATEGDCVPHRATPIELNTPQQIAVTPFTCTDGFGRTAAIRSFTLDRTADVVMETRTIDPDSGYGRVFFFGAGAHGDQEDAWAEGEEGAPARVARNLGPGTYYVIFSGGARHSSVVASVRTLASMTTASPPRGAEAAACEDPSQAPALSVGRAVTGQLTTNASCIGAYTPDGRDHWFDLYRVVVPQRQELVIGMETSAFAPAIVLYRADGTPIGAQSAAEETKATGGRITLDAGEYLVAAGHAALTEMGSYRLTAMPYTGE